MGRYRYRYGGGRAAVICAVLLLILLGAFLLVGFARRQLRPLLTQLATARVTSTVHQIISDAVTDSVADGVFRYEDLVSFETDNEGKITAVKTNMPEFNRLQATILEEILNRMSEVSTRELSIPVGNLTGSNLLAGRGPRIAVRMQSVGSSSAELKNEFTSAGINQTRHQIVMEVDVAVSILLPGFATATHVSNSLCVAETIIVGSVPDTYTYFSTSPEDYEEDVKDHILNKG